MTRPGIEPRSPGPLANTLTAGPMYTILLALESQGWPVNAWQDVLQDVLCSIRSLLCTTTSATPHESMFNFERRSSTGTALPVWLCEPGEVLLKQFGGRSKYDPIVVVVELLEANPTHVRIWFRNGREDSVALRHLASFPRSYWPQDSAENVLPDVSSANPTSSPDISSKRRWSGESESQDSFFAKIWNGGELLPCWSSRICKPVQRLDLQKWGRVL